MRKRSIATWLTAAFFCVAASCIPALAQVVGGVGGASSGGGDSLWNDDSDGTISASNTVVTVNNDLEVQGTIRSEEGVSGVLNLKAEDHIDLELDSDNSAVGSLRVYDYNKANLRFWLDPFGDAGFFGTVTASVVEVEGEVFGDPWNSSLEVPTKNDLYDYLITLENLSYLPEAQTEWSMTQTQLDTFLAGSFNGNSLITAGVKSIPFLASETFTFDGTLTKFTTGSGPTYFPHGIAWYHIGTGPTFSTVDFFAAYGSAPMVEVLDAVPTLLGAAEAGSWFMVPHDPIEFEAGEVYALVLIPDTDGTPEALTPNYYYYSSGTLPGLITGTKYTGSAAAQSDVYVHTAWSTDKTTGEWKARSDTGYAILRLVDADSSGVEVSTLAVDSTIQADYNAGTSTLGLSATPQQLQVGEGDAADDIQWFSTTGDEPSFSAADYGNNGAMVLMVRAETEQSWKGIRMRFDTAERNETWNFYVRDANNQITYAQKEAYADSGSGNESVSILFDEAFTTVEDRVYLIVAEHDYDSDHDYETYSTGLDWTTTEWTVLGHAGVDDGDNAFIPPGSLTSVPAMAPIIGDTGYRPTLALETGDGIEVSYDAGTHTSTISARDFTQHRTWSFDPAAVCDGDVDRLFLMTVGQDLPDGANIVQWSLSFEADPTTEADVDFKYADAFIGVANSAVIDVCDTTAGVSGESTPANINGGAAVANGKVMYLEFGTEYTETGHQMVFEVWYESE